MKIRLLVPALLILVAPLLHSSTTKSAVPFIENDFERGMARAKAKGIPIFAEAWAPW